MISLYTKTKPALFIARPWDSSFKEIYRPLIIELLPKWEIYDGPLVIKDDANWAERENFIRRNKQLYEQIVSNIKASDVFIADVTNANANVMLELGIAIQLNKNVIIMTGQDRNKLPFDIQGFKAEKYLDTTDLIKKLSQQLMLFLSIKEQDFDNAFHENLVNVSEGELTGHRSIIEVQLPKIIKNLKLRVEFKLINPSDELDWFGIYFRSTSSIQPAELVYVRSNKSLEVVPIPTPPGKTPIQGKNIEDEYITHDGFSILEVIIDGNKLFAKSSKKELYYENVQNESFGNIFLQSNAHHKDEDMRKKFKVEFRSLNIINIDTTTPV